MKAPHSLRCREHPMIRAERLENLVWGEVKRVLEHPDLIVAGLAALDGDADDDVAGELARTERELAGVQLEEDRAIRLYVTGKITEEQLDHQRRFIGERLERFRARLDEYRTRASATASTTCPTKNVANSSSCSWTRPRSTARTTSPSRSPSRAMGNLCQLRNTDHRPPTTDHRPPTGAGAADPSTVGARYG